MSSVCHRPLKGLDNREYTAAVLKDSRTVESLDRLALLYSMEPLREIPNPRTECDGQGKKAYVDAARRHRVSHTAASPGDPDVLG